MGQDIVVVDARDHLLGRLASIVAKQLLEGKKVVLVRCEAINMSGSLFRNKTKWWAFLRKRHNTNPKRGPFHERSPSKMLYRVIRGMMPHRTARGQAALQRLKLFEGIPPRYQKTKRMVIPQALRMLHLRADRKYCTLGRLAHDMGWSYQGVIQTLEEKRRVEHSAYAVEQKQQASQRKQAIEKIGEKEPQLMQQLEQLGY